MDIVINYKTIYICQPQTDMTPNFALNPDQKGNSTFLIKGRIKSQFHSLISYPSNGHSGRGVHNIHRQEQQDEQLVSLGLHSSWVGKGVQNMEGVHQPLPRPQALPQQQQLRELRATIERKNQLN